jgi:hypothetical protein
MKVLGLSEGFRAGTTREPPSFPGVTLAIIDGRACTTHLAILALKTRDLTNDIEDRFECIQTVAVNQLFNVGPSTLAGPATA